MDIGNLDVTLHLGFPGSFSSYWQQLGRAGRAGKPSLSVLVCFESPLDQHILRHPEALFHSTPEAVSVSIDNDYILRAHLPCAARERVIGVRRCAYSASSGAAGPLLWPGCDNSGISPYQERAREEERRAAGSGGDTGAGFFPSGHENRPPDHCPAGPGMSNSDDDDSAVFGSGLVEAIRFLVGCGRLQLDENRTNADPTFCYFRCAPALINPQRDVSLRLTDPVSFSVMDVTRGPPETGLKLDTVPYSRAFFELFQGTPTLRGRLPARWHDQYILPSCLHCMRDPNCSQLPVYLFNTNHPTWTT